ncbi:hypothetical protein CHS0354_003199 [Potamilus streckersoni]|uniref:Protein quiver n=1 Tax=Potamilus streckersoni TaxID=2493646 RepID=A0AAE0SJR6_9BIVA|nr:hypothetical protein CHS0354_003199 [Potamilus streckersoni]
MRNFGVVCIFILGFVFPLRSVAARECYKCETLDKSCNDPFNKNVGISKTQCSGACYKWKREMSGVQVTKRGCYDGLQEENKCNAVKVNEVKVNSCLCNGDLCNGALPVGWPFIVLVALIVIYILF